MEWYKERILKTRSKAALRKCESDACINKWTVPRPEEQNMFLLARRISEKRRDDTCHFKMSLEIPDILAKKRNKKELAWEEIEHFVKCAMDGTAKDVQIGAFMMACHLNGMTEVEVELLMKAMMFSGTLLRWPKEWKNNITSLQSTGSTGNKAKLILAPAMAACGLKFPILSSRGIDVVGGVLSKLSTIPGFDGSSRSFAEIQVLLDKVGCCVVHQPQAVAPAERLFRDVGSVITVGHDNAFNEACMISRVAAMQLTAIVMEIPYGGGEWMKTRSQAQEMGEKLVRAVLERHEAQLAEMMGIKFKVLLTHAEYPVGRMIGQSLEVAEAVKVLNGEGPADLQHLVCQLGGHLLMAAGLVADEEEGADKVMKHIKDGSARKKFETMLRHQGVERNHVKSLMKPRHGDSMFGLGSVLPAAKYFTHLSVEECGFVHRVDMSLCSEVMFQLTQSSMIAKESMQCMGGIQLLVNIGSHLNTGEMWAKIHHNIRLSESHINRLKKAITLRLDTPLYDDTVDITPLKIT